MTTGPVPVPVPLPRLGQAMTDATIVSWQAQPGDEVAEGDVLLVVETDKTEFDLESPAAGTLGPHLVAPGDVCEVGTVLVELNAEGAVPAVVPAPPPATTAPVVQQAPAGGRVRASPKAKALARERRIDLGQVTGSGPDGLIVEADLPTDLPAASASGRADGGQRRKLTPVQRTAAARLIESWTTAPHFVQMVDVDFTALAALRARWSEKGGVLAQVSWNDIIAAAFARTIADHPHLNARLDGDEIVLAPQVDLGVAVENERGLLVPVLADAARASLTDVSARLQDMARTGAGDPCPSTTTISNLGRYGIRMGTPVLNQGEAVLLFVGSIEPRAVVRQGEIVARTMGTLSVAYDHRMVDGAVGARFLTDLRERLEHPEQHL